MNNPRSRYYRHQNVTASKEPEDVQDVNGTTEQLPTNLEGTPVQPEPNPLEMESTAYHVYNGKPLRRGDRFTANSKADADDLEAIKFAHRVGRYDRRDMQPK